MERTERLPVDSDQLAPRRPIPMRLVVRRPNPRTLGVYPDKMVLVMLNQIHHALLQKPVRRILAQRKHMLGRIHLLLVDPAALDADGVDEQRDERHRHLHLWGRLRGRGRQGCRGWLRRAYAVQRAFGLLEL